MHMQVTDFIVDFITPVFSVAILRHGIIRNASAKDLGCEFITAWIEIGVQPFRALHYNPETENMLTPLAALQIPRSGSKNDVRCSLYESEGPWRAWMIRQSS